MRKCFYAVIGFFLLGLSLSMAQANSAEKKTGSTIEVRVNYSGSGTVDEKHQIFVVLWDSSNFVEPNNNTIPIAVQSTASKNGIVTFSDVQARPAFVSAAYDPSGNWDAHSAPPSGTSLGLYSKTGKPEPIDTEPGKTTKIELKFDDSVKMP